MKKIILSLFVLIPLFSSFVHAGESRELNQKEKEAVEAAVRKELKDPDSAKFELGEFKNPENHVYCGFVSAKNSYGGYTGKALFRSMIWVKESGDYYVAVLDIAGPSSRTVQSQVTRESCRSDGY